LYFMTQNIHVAKKRSLRYLKAKILQFISVGTI
jgi:hypothetical protein